MPTEGFPQDGNTNFPARKAQPIPIPPRPRPVPPEPSVVKRRYEKKEVHEQKHLDKRKEGERLND